MRERERKEGEIYSSAGGVGVAGGVSGGVTTRRRSAATLSDTDQKPLRSVGSTWSSLNHDVLTCAAASDASCSTLLLTMSTTAMSVRPVNVPSLLWWWLLVVVVVGSDDDDDDEQKMGRGVEGEQTR